MTNYQFTPANKTETKARVALVGPAGSGKTMSALRMAKGMGGRIAVIDTENGSAAKYSRVVAFDTLKLRTFSPLTYVDAIQAAEAQGYDLIIVDGLSHAWMGKDGALEQVDAAVKRSRSGNTFTAWRDVTPQHNRLIDSLVGCRAHLICTMRSKTEYVLQDEVRDGKSTKVPRKIGTAPVQRDGLEYEFDIVGDIDLDHNFIISKSRCEELDRKVIERPGEELGETIMRWLRDTDPPPPPPPPTEAEDVYRLKAKPYAGMLITAPEVAEDWLQRAAAHQATGKNLRNAAVAELLRRERLRAHEPEPQESDPAPAPGDIPDESIPF